MRRATALLALAGAAGAVSEGYVRENGPLLFANFKKEWNKVYSAAEEPGRYHAFLTNMIESARLEQENPGASFGATKFADLTAEEFKPYHSGLLANPGANATGPPDIFTAEEVARALTSSVDWRDKGAVTHVKDQGSCGSCWSFSSTGGIEGAWAAAGNKLTSVSEQELVSCDKKDNGCGGGLMQNAYQWLSNSESGKIVTEQAYPYKSGGGSSGSCKSISGMDTGATITSYKILPKKEDQMATYVSTTGPLPIGVNAASGWQSYRGGIVSNCRNSQADHGVLIVGYHPKYWIVKNSWGSSWGENGFIRLQYGTNQCGLTQDAVSVKCPSAGPPTKYHCDKDSKTCALAYQGHSTQAKCEEACNPTPAYACEVDRGSYSCGEVPAGLPGSFPTLAACQATCKPPALQ